MTDLRVWAPHAERMEVVGDEQRLSLRAEDGGWFSGSHDFNEYMLSLDGGEPRPDPRSPWQPRGVHGPSRVVDHEIFRWTDDTWKGFPLRDAVIYELHIGTFTSSGTFQAAIEKLDHLVGLGVNAVELMPLNEFPGDRGWGYDGVDLYAPHHAYGGPEGLKHLVDACHSKGLAVILDVVYNHLGPAGNFLREFGPYFTDRYGTPWGDAVNLDDRGSTEVRNFFIENALGWLDNYHFDGLRLDAIHAIYDQSAIHFLEELAARVDEHEKRSGRTLWLIAESDLNDPRVVRPRDAGGYGIDAQWSDDLHHSLHALLTGEKTGYYSDFGTIAHVAKALRHAFVYDGKPSAFRGRVHGRPTEGLDGERFLGYLQTHDQVGNRALGERSSALMDHDLLKVGAALVLTSPFVPMLFQGEEWGATTPFLYFTDHDDPDLRKAVREGRRREFAAFGWDPDEIADPQDPSTFERSKLDWSELDDPRHADLLAWHRDLIRARREVPDLGAGGMKAVDARFDEDERWLVVRRGTATVLANLSDAERTIPVKREPGRLLLSSGGEISGTDPSGTDENITLPRQSASIYVRDR